MEIEFNPSRYPKPDVGSTQPVARRDSSAPAVSTTDSFRMSADLESKLHQIPLVRPEVVARAKTLAADVQYPPDEMLTSISTLLALHMKS
jgi:hypothetical protein